MTKKHPYGFAHGPRDRHAPSGHGLNETRDAASHEAPNLADEIIFPPGHQEYMDQAAKEADEAFRLKAAEGVSQAEAAAGAGAQPEEAPIQVSVEELSALAKKYLCPHCEVQKEAESTRLRALADTDNARKRMLREAQESARYAASSVLADLLPALDNLDLAIEHAQGQEACKNFVLGVDMTRKLLLETLKHHGLESIGQVGETFDPTLHEAVTTEAHPEVPSGAVCTMLTKGYKLKDRLLRPARVVVCKK